jgi:hypothetical protein
MADQAMRSGLAVMTPQRERAAVSGSPACRVMKRAVLAVARISRPVPLAQNISGRFTLQLHAHTVRLLKGKMMSTKYMLAHDSMCDAIERDHGDCFPVVYQLHALDEHGEFRGLSRLLDIDPEGIL